MQVARETCNICLRMNRASRAVVACTFILTEHPRVSGRAAIFTPPITTGRHPLPLWGEKA